MWNFQPTTQCQVQERNSRRTLAQKPTVDTTRSLRVQVRHPSDHLPLIPRMNLQLLKQSRARPSLRRRPFFRSPIINIPVRFVHKLERRKKKGLEQRKHDNINSLLREEDAATRRDATKTHERTNARTLSNSESSSASIVPRCSCANVPRSKSFSSVPRLRLWYTRRARVVSIDSPGRGSGLGGGGPFAFAFVGDVVEAMCSGV